MKPDDNERRSRDTRPRPAWRGADPATPCKAAQPPPPPAMKRLALLLPLPAMKPTIPFLLLASAASGFARDPAAGGSRAEEPRVETY